MTRQQTTMGEASNFIGWDVEELNSHLDSLLSHIPAIATDIDYQVIDGMLVADYEWDEEPEWDEDDGGQG